ncbi:MAG: FGGY family carbohydrate kinase [Candidatus Atribacteria bacterium]|nr:FGGY family carbohydrate kinase [Candidatus Atribacteria bacterium]
MSIIGLDVGTTTSKGIVLSDQGEVLGKTYREYKVITKNETWLELDSNQVWESVKSILAELAFISNKDKIKAISVSAMGDTITPFDELLHPLYNSILAFDTRSITEAHTLGSRLGEEWIFKTTGMPLHPTYSACKILWIKNNLPKVFHKTSRFLCYEDFISMKLGSGAAISFSNAARTMFFDINKLTWNQKILNECSIQEDQLSKPMKSFWSLLISLT